jgi:hypothetical protein
MIAGGEEFNQQKY